MTPELEKVINAARFRKNVAELRRSGYPERQALAIAYRQRRAG